MGIFQPKKKSTKLLFEKPNSCSSKSVLISATSLVTQLTPPCIYKEDDYGLNSPTSIIIIKLINKKKVFLFSPCERILKQKPLNALKKYLHKVLIQFLD